MKSEGRRVENSIVGKMKKLSCIFALLGVLGLGACKSEGPDAGQLAAVAAKGYYDLLVEGKWQEFLAGYNQPNRLPDGYQKQLLLNAQMFMEQQQMEHNGLVKVNVLNAKADTAHHVADVFLQMVYGDSTKEQIVVPMVEVKGEWKLR